MNLARLQLAGVDLKQCQACSLGIESGKEMRKEIGFVSEAPEESDGECVGLGTLGFCMLTHAATKEMHGDLLAGAGDEGWIKGTKAFAHLLAKGVLRGHDDGRNRTDGKNGTDPSEPGERW